MNACSVRGRQYGKKSLCATGHPSSFVQKIKTLKKPKIARRQRSGQRLLAVRYHTDAVLAAELVWLVNGALWVIAPLSIDEQTVFVPAGRQ